MIPSGGRFFFYFWFSPRGVWHTSTVVAGLNFCTLEAGLHKREQVMSFLLPPEFLKI